MRNIARAAPTRRGILKTTGALAAGIAAPALIGPHAARGVHSFVDRLTDQGMGEVDATR